ncbi:hypothetical protein C8R44DRAFT_759919 [Mycena epipterygia]|nr:hypothetical protein C8R44DRAFT_759919 [Mycena epipterygia]
MESTVDNVFGVMLIAVILSAVLYGAGFVQFWMYIRKYHSTDPSAMKYLVIAVLICDTCQQGLITHLIYRTLVSSIADPSILKSAVSTGVYQLYFGGAVATMVQQFFCWRIYKVGKSVILPGAVSFVSWTALENTALRSLLNLNIRTVTAAKYGSASLLANTSLQVLAIVTNSLSAGVDVTISVTLVYLLQSSKTGFTKATTDLINRLIIFTFTTGLPTTVFALLSAICIGAFPKTQLYLFFYMIVGRLYTNSLLVTLNSREFIKFGSQNASGEQYSLERSGIPQWQRERETIAVRIDTDRTSDLNPELSVTFPQPRDTK